MQISPCLLFASYQIYYYCSCTDSKKTLSHSLSLLTCLLSLIQHYFFTFTLLFPQGNSSQPCVPHRVVEGCSVVLDMSALCVVGWAPNALMFSLIRHWHFYDNFFPEASKHCCFWSQYQNRWSFGRVIKRRGPH